MVVAVVEVSEVVAVSVWLWQKHVQRRMAVEHHKASLQRGWFQNAFESDIVMFTVCIENTVNGFVIVIYVQKWLTCTIYRNS